MFLALSQSIVMLYLVLTDRYAMLAKSIADPMIGQCLLV